jgi:uridine kinase
LAEWHEVSPGGIVIVEGVSSGRASVRERLSLSLWVETPVAVRLARGLRRDGNDARLLWQRWIADEDRHFAADCTAEHADLIVSGDST